MFAAEYDVMTDQSHSKRSWYRSERKPGSRDVGCAENLTKLSSFLVYLTKPPGPTADFVIGIYFEVFGMYFGMNFALNFAD